MKRPANNSRWAAGALIAFAILALGAPASAQEPTAAHKFDEVVREAVAEGRSLRAIVRFKNDAARLRAVETITSRGGRIRRAHNEVTGLSVDLDAQTAAQLASDFDTLTISVDATVRSAGTGGGRAARSSGAKNARQRFNRSGRGVSVAIIDSGVQPHSDLPASRIRKFVDFVNGRTMPYDDFGHGTHVAGIVAGNGASSWFLEDPLVGAAPEVDIVALKVLDSQGAGKTSDVIAALEWVAQNHAAYNIRVVNLSLGHPVYEPASTDPLVQAAEALVARGIVVVASAGNLGIDPTDNLPGHGGITSPANGARIIAVGAVDNKGTLTRSDDEVAAYSSRGPTRFDVIVKPDLVASGHRVASLSAPNSFLFQSYPELHVRASSELVARYMILSGTSMAAPLVSGTAALMLETNPRLSVGTVRAVLEFTAQHLPNTGLLAQGAGQLNALGAVRLARVIKPRVGRGQIWLKSQGGVPQAYDMLHGEPVAWAKNIVWGDGVLLGDAAYVHLAAWDDNIVWGQDVDNIVWGQCNGDECDNIVWGQCDGEGCDNIVWGQTNDNIVWGQDIENIVWGQCEDTACDNIVWGQDGDNIVWGQCEGNECDNIVWGQCASEGCDNIVWGQCQGTTCDNIVWGQDGSALGYWANNTVWGFWDNSVNWTLVKRTDADNIVWGQDYLDNIVWGQCASGTCDNIVWGQGDDNIVWGQTLRVLTMGGQQ
jgi:serine protease AprX